MEIISRLTLQPIIIYFLFYEFYKHFIYAFIIPYICNVLWSYTFIKHFFISFFLFFFCPTAFYLLSCPCELGCWVIFVSKGFPNEVCDSSLPQSPLTAPALQEELRPWAPLLIALFGRHCWILDPWNWILPETLSFSVMGSVRQSYHPEKSALESWYFISFSSSPSPQPKDTERLKSWQTLSLSQFGERLTLWFGKQGRESMTNCSLGSPWRGVRGDKAWQEAVKAWRAPSSTSRSMRFQP